MDGGQKVGTERRDTWGFLLSLGEERNNGRREQVSVFKKVTLFRLWIWEERRERGTRKSFRFLVDVVVFVFHTMMISRIIIAATYVDANFFGAQL